MMIKREILSLSQEAYAPLLFHSLLGLSLTATYIGQGLLIAQVFSSALSGEAWEKNIGRLTLTTFLILGRALIVWSSEVVSQLTAQTVKERLRSRLYRKLLDLGPSYLLTRRTGDLQTLIVGSVEALEGYFGRYFPAVIVAALGAPAIVVTLGLHDFKSGLILGLFVLAYPIANDLWLRWRLPRSSLIFAAMGAFSSFIIDSLQGMMTLKAFNATGRRREELVQEAEKLRSESMNDLSVSLMRTGILAFLSIAGVAALLIYGTYRVINHDLNIANLFLILFLAREAFRPVEKMDREFHAAYAGMSAVDLVTKFLSELPTPPRNGGRQRMAPVGASIEFDRASFSYPGAQKEALKDVSFQVQPGSVTAVVGPSGGGKTTIISLLMRFFDPQKGAVRIGGIDLKDFSLDSLYSMIAVVSQDTYLFHGTIAENLRLAKPDATSAEIHEAAQAANAHEFIVTLPQGYDTAIGEKGAGLSGGQKQRIAIARAILKNAPILILDEATSSVDTKSETSIQAALSEVMKNKTAIVIAHRLSAVKNADQIIVLDRGRIIQVGSHQSLSNEKGLYAQLIASQGVLS